MPMDTQFSVKNALIYAIDSLFSHPWYFLKLFMVWLAICLISVFALVSLLIGTFVFSFASLVFILFIISFWLLWMTALVWYFPPRIALDFYDNGPDPMIWKKLFSSFSLLPTLRLIIALMLYGIIISVGLALLIIPGIYWAVRFQFAFLHIVDTDAGIISAFKKSYAITKNNFWSLLLFNAITLFCRAVFLPLGLLMLVYGYRQLSGVPGHQENQ
jgi:uncharacterized membrane protein